VNENITANTFVAPYNDIETLQKVVRKHRREVAAVILEPVYYNGGTVLPKPGYLESVRELTEEYDMLLIFDEIISGFRFAVGGAQQYYRVKADYATYGKAIANGYPISALVGNEEKMKVLDPENRKKVVTGGTFNAHYVSIAALSASLEELKGGHVQHHLIQLAEKLQREFMDVAERAHVKARIQAFGGGWGLYFTDKEVTNYREAQATDGGRGTKFMKIRNLLMADGIYLHPRHKYHHGLSYSHTAEDIDYLLTKMESALKST
jgi:glutamate-1-semialdehyde 2,1-aminomutase